MIRFFHVMAGLGPAIHALLAARKDAGGRHKVYIRAGHDALKRLLIALSLLAAPCNALAQGGAQQRPMRVEVWDLKLGAPVGALPEDFSDYACGTNGGPPSIALNGFADFMRCRPE